MSSSKPRPTLLTLPGELRNLIWSYTLQTSQSICIFEPTYSRPPGTHTTTAKLKIISEPAISQVCKTLREEVLSIYYGANQFYVGKIACRQQQPRYFHTYEQYMRALRRWRRYLQTKPAARYLRGLDFSITVCLDIGTGHLHDQSFHVTLAIKDGNVEKKLSDGLDDYCICQYNDSTAVADSDDVVDGRAMVDTALAICEVLHPVVAEDQCGTCNSYRISAEMFK